MWCPVLYDKISVTTFGEKTEKEENIMRKKTVFFSGCMVVYQHVPAVAGQYTGKGGRS